jgi:hypothetical protein
LKNNRFSHIKFAGCEERHGYLMLKRNDLILIGVILVLCVAVFTFINLTKKEGSKVVITVDGKVYDTLNLDKDTTFTVKGEDGEFNTFKITNGYVDMVEASCPDKLCVKQNDIHYNNETIVCLPNKVVLQIKDGEENDVDMIAN